MPPSKSSRTSTAAAAPTAAPNAGGGAPAAAGARQGVHAAPAAAAAPEPAAAAPKAPRKPLKINDLVTIPVALFGQEWCELNYPAATHGAGWWKLPGSRLQGRVKANGDNPGWWKMTKTNTTPRRGRPHPNPNSNPNPNRDPNPNSISNPNSNQEELRAMNVPQLRELCKGHDLSDKGNKVELLVRLMVRFAER